MRSPMMTGEIVKTVQRRLEELNLHPGPIDGAYGSQTAAAVQAFQDPDDDTGVRRRRIRTQSLRAHVTAHEHAVFVVTTQGQLGPSRARVRANVPVDAALVAEAVAIAL